MLVLGALAALAAAVCTCGGGGRLRLGTARPPRPVGAARPQALHVLDLRAADQVNIGDRYLELGYNFRAKREYMRVIEQFPGTPETAIAQYRIGTCYLREEMYPEALEQFRLFVGNFPGHVMANEARRQIDQLAERQPSPPRPRPTTVEALPADLAEAKARQEAAERALAEAKARQEASERALAEAKARQSAAEKALAEQAARAGSDPAAAEQAADRRKLAALEQALAAEHQATATRVEEAERKHRLALTRAAEEERKRLAAERQAREAEQARQASEKRLAVREQQLAAAEARARSAELRASKFNNGAAAAKTPALEQERKLRQAAEQRASTAERAQKSAQQRVDELEARVETLRGEQKSSTERADREAASGRELAGRLALADQRAVAAERRLKTAEQQLADSEQRAAQAEQRARTAAEARAAAESEARQAAEARAQAVAAARKAAEARAAAEAQARKEAEARAAAEASKRIAPAAPAVPRTVAAQVLHLPDQQLDQVEQRLADMAAAGINTVILRVFHNKGDRKYGFSKSRAAQGVYFRTDRAPVVDDALGKILPLASKHGLKVWAWMTSRYATYGLNLEPEWRAARYDFQTGTIVPAKGLNLFHPQVQEHLAGLYRDLARYPIDGVLFQDDLVLRHTEGMSEQARAAFQREMGRPLDPRELYEGVYLSDDGKYHVSRYTDRFWDWAAWKNRKLLQLAERLMTAARGKRPELRFGINLMYEAVVSPRNALAWLSQSVSEARKVGFDLYSVMAYHRQMQAELGLNPKETAHLMAKLGREAVRMVGDPSKVLIKVQARDWETRKRVPTAELEQMLARGLEAGPVSVAVVPCSDARDLVALRKVLAPAP